ncbi:hypothetical protein CAPTEDRAFT_189925 [Capitella teleta]|uniref:Uncharacterized protein n=1 Tax=Capitella teleta TaxID=283909 RepID=R7UFR3_CAPTE|nr:hypothetical protein CAPTEDRAFT_189925 [Capitella teleta]|eukprot:ELU05374.1 hypothetical protein CAPTEDRAFT_189925 [Capitella teleta]
MSNASINPTIPLPHCRIPNEKEKTGNQSLEGVRALSAQRGFKGGLPVRETLMSLASQMTRVILKTRPKSRHETDYPEEGMESQKWNIGKKNLQKKKVGMIATPEAVGRRWKRRERGRERERESQIETRDIDAVGQIKGRREDCEVVDQSWFHARARSIKDRINRQVRRLIKVITRRPSERCACPYLQSMHKH